MSDTEIVKTPRVRRPRTVKAPAPAPAVPAIESWKDREEARFASGDYKALPHYFYRFETRDHFAHYSKEQKGMIAFTESPAKGEADRQAFMKPGKYLTKYFGDVMTASEITRLASQFTAETTDTPIKFAVTAEEIIAVYAMDHSFASCFKGQKKVGGYAGDFQVAYLEDKDRPNYCKGRVIVCREKMFYTPITYGDGVTLRAELEKLGYHAMKDKELLGLRVYQDYGGGLDTYDFGRPSQMIHHDEKGRPYRVFRQN